MPDATHFTFALVEDFTHVAFACAVDPLRIANLVAGKPLYSWSLASLDGRTACSSNGTKVLTEHRFDAMPHCDYLFVLSGLNMRTHDTRVLRMALRRIDRHAKTHIGALCSGAWILAQGGFLDARPAAIHWEYHDSFAEQFPQVDLVRNVFVADDRHMTASGGTAAADLMLHLIAQDHGQDLSNEVADQLVYNAVREASAPQKASLQSRHAMRNKHLAVAIKNMQDNLDAPISPSVIAADLGISVRQLERLFGKYLNTTPKRYFVELRLHRARHLLVQTEMSVTDVAMACGYENVGHFSRTYRATFGVAPMKQRGRLS
ncbi:MAG: GlxA family transcriptional regulator [Pseudomonadota bacterium]